MRRVGISHRFGMAWTSADSVDGVELLRHGSYLTNDIKYLRCDTPEAGIIHVHAP